MQRNLKYVLLSTIIAIVGILIFQVYWISTTYDSQSSAFEIEINTALEDALNEDIKDKTLDRYFKRTLMPGDTLISGGRKIPVEEISPGKFILPFESSSWKIEQSWIEENDSITIYGTGEFESWSYGSVDDPGEINIDAGEAGELFNIVVSSLMAHQPDLQEIENRYKSELKKRRIETPFYLAYIQDGHIFDLTGDDPGIFAGAQAVQKIPGRNFSNGQVLAFFPETRSYLIKGMWLTLLASFLLVSMVAGSFLIMIQTIFRQKKVSEVKNDFINNMTHEFKTPIATVSAAMEAMVSFDALKDREKTNRYIDISRKEMDRLAGLVEKILSISAYEQKTLILNKETFDICQLINETAQQYIMKGNGRVEIDFDPSTPAFIHADRLHFQNIINNLLDNAVKYSKDECKIDIKCLRQADYVIFNVKDNGIGISKEQQKHIFERFYRVPTGDLHSVKGFGLGLSYVKHIVELHQGTIGVRSQPGQGTEFTIAIPDINE